MMNGVLLLALALSSLAACQGFGFQLPKMPWDNNSATLGSSTSTSTTLQPGDTIAVIGASGNVGKLVALRLSDTYKVNGIVRDPSSVSKFFDGRDNINLYTVDLLNDGRESPSDDLRSALETANALVICTGTTAFPTKAWSRTGESDIGSDVLSALVENKFKVKDAISSLDEKGYNTPNNVDAMANEFLMDTWRSVCKVTKKRAILLSSIGVQRRDVMPFPILNACGVLDAKATGEAAIERCAEECGFSYTIVRPGQLFGGPYDNNYYLGTLFQLDKNEESQDVQVGRGDELLGDTLRSTLAEVTAQICEKDCARDMDFTVVNVKGSSPTLEDVEARLEGL